MDNVFVSRTLLCSGGSVVGRWILYLCLETPLILYGGGVEERDLYREYILPGTEKRQG